MKRNLLQYSDLYFMMQNFTKMDRKVENNATKKSLEVEGAYVEKN